MGMTMRPHSEDGIVSEVKSKVDTRNFYGLDLLIPDKDHTENLSSRNLASILANFFGDLSPISIDFCSSSAFFVSSSNFAVFNSISSYKPLDFISSGGPATCNPSNILAFYH